MVDPLIASRAVHFAASLVVAGVAIFSAIIRGVSRTTSRAVKRQDWLMLAALVVAVLSGAAWLLFLAANIAQSTVTAAIGDGTTWGVLTDTQFGRVWIARLLVAMLLFCIWLVGTPTQGLHSLTLLQALLAVIFVGTLAWSGHAAGTTGLGGIIHFANDASHLIAAGAWVGGLIPLLLFLSPRVRGLEPPLDECYGVLRRFSTLAAWSVTALALSGLVNTWYMTDGLQNFLGTEYGDLVLVKVALFIVMLAFGAANRYWLTPRLLAAAKGGTLRLLCTSISVEILLGLVVICVVAVLGELEPPGHMHHMDMTVGGRSNLNQG